MKSNTNSTIKKKKRGREGGRNSNSVLAISAFSLVSSLSSSRVVVAQPGGGAAAACVNPMTASLGLSLNNPKPADLRKDTGCTYNAGTETYVDPGDSTKSKTLSYSPGESAVSTNAHIYNSFEAGFTSTQDNVISGWGCSTPSLLYDSTGGLDLGLAESKVRKLCYDSVAWLFPNVQADNSYRGCVGPCGGHTNDYHFHGRYHCLYEQTGEHSTKIGDVGPYIMYGKWEDFENKKLPHLDACGAHIGKTPDSPSEAVYHYHAQDRGPYGVGCYGDGTNLVTVEKCRSLYPECNDAEVETFTDMPQPDGTIKTFSYDRDCPCFDANGLNTGTITERAIIAAPTVLSYDASEWTCGSGVSCMQTVEKTLGYTDYVGSSTTTTTTTTTDTTTTTTDTGTSGGASTKAMLATAGATITAALLV